MRLTHAFFRILSCVVMLGLAACTARFKTDYDQSVPVQMSSTWRLSDVTVTVPDSLVVSEAKTLLPRADIVWREDPPGDRKAQIARIISDATKQGAAGLQGDRPVRFEITVQRFHALTFEAEARLVRSGVHDVEFTIRAVDATTGDVLAGPTMILAAMPALVGAEMVEARSNGESQKMHISRHLRMVIAGWLGLGPDPRGAFTRIGA